MVRTIRRSLIWAYYIRPPSAYRIKKQKNQIKSQLAAINQKPS
jgi:hypothetical protein